MVTPNQLLDYSLPIGSIIFYPGEIYDNNGQLLEHLRLGGWIEAKGQTLVRDEYRQLFGVIGTKYSYNLPSDSLFQLPDMRGLFIRGVQNERREERTTLDDIGAIKGERLEYKTLGPQGSQQNYYQVGSVQYGGVEEHQHETLNIIESRIPDKGVPCKVISETRTLDKTPTGGFGIEETRPTNIAMYSLMKVNHSLFKKD